MSSISNCTFVSKEEQFTKENLDKMRLLFNGKTITFKNEKINIGNILKKQYGDVDSDLGRRMFDLIVGRGTQGKPAIDSYTGFSEADFRRIKNELVRESKKLNNPKLNYLEKLLFVRRGVMQKFAITNYLNNKINGSANYERTQFSNYLKSHNDIMALLKTDAIKNRGESKFRLGIKSVRDLEKLENQLTIIINNPKTPEQANKAMDITKQMSEIFKSDGGVPLQELRMFLEGELTESKGRYFKIENDGSTVEVSREIIEAGKLSRNLLNDMGLVMINGLKQHKQVIRQSYLNSKEDSSLLLPNGDKVRKYEETIESQIKEVQKGIKDGNYFPHYLIESFIKIEKIMDKAEKDKYSNVDQDLTDLSQVFLQMSKEINTPRTLRGRKSIPYDNYLKNHDVQDLVSSQPEIAKAIIRLYDIHKTNQNQLSGITNVDGGESNFEGMSGNISAEIISDLIQKNSNYFPAIEKVASNIIKNLNKPKNINLFVPLSEYLAKTHNIRVATIPPEIKHDTIRYYDPVAKTLVISDRLPQASRTFLVAQQMGLLLADKEIDTILDDNNIEEGEVRKLGRLALSNYFAVASFCTSLNI